jgi:molybdopterin-containing oxidoreductase family molybdopterin binding subunit
MYEAIETGKPYPVKALWFAAYNPVNQNPDYNRFVKSLLPNIDFIVTVDMFMTSTAQHSDIVLPACSFYECMELCPPFDTHNTFLCLQEKVIEPLYESRSHIDMVSAVGREMGFAQDFNLSEEECAELLLSSDHESMEGVTLEKLRENPIALPDYDVPVFLTASGRLEFYSEAMIPFGQALPVYKEPLESTRRPLVEKYPLSLITGHSRYMKCSMLVNSPLMRSLDPEPRLEMNPVDADARGIMDGDMVTAFNDRGKVKLKCKLHQGIKPGLVNLNQGWWPENYEEGTHQELSHFVRNKAQEAAFEPNAALYDILVEVKKA